MGAQWDVKRVTKYSNTTVPPYTTCQPLLPAKVPNRYN